jgi:6-phosphogluconolactonase
MQEPKRSEVIVFPDKESLSRDAAYRVCTLAQSAARLRGRFALALAGGSTPALLYRLLLNTPFVEAMPWAATEFWFGDDRCVAPDAPESNYRMAREALLDALPTTPGGIYRMPTEMPDHEAAAQLYEAQLQQVFGVERDAWPRFDLILLGMGPDGHCASLFPHKPALQEQKRLVVATEPGLKPFVPRLTLTFPVLNHAAHVLFLVAGADKAETLARVLHGPPLPNELPSQSVALQNGPLTWLVDRAAAAQE